MPESNTPSRTFQIWVPGGDNLPVTVKLTGDLEGALTLRYAAIQHLKQMRLENVNALPIYQKEIRGTAGNQIKCSNSYAGELIDIYVPPPPTTGMETPNSQFIPAFEAIDAKGNYIGLVLCMSGTWQPPYKFVPVATTDDGHSDLTPFGYGNWAAGPTDSPTDQKAPWWDRTTRPFKGELEDKTFTDPAFGTITDISPHGEAVAVEDYVYTPATSTMKIGPAPYGTFHCSSAWNGSNDYDGGFFLTPNDSTDGSWIWVTYYAAYPWKSSGTASRTVYNVAVGGSSIDTCTNGGSTASSGLIYLCYSSNDVSPGNEDMFGGPDNYPANNKVGEQTTTREDTTLSGSWDNSVIIENPDWSTVDKSGGYAVLVPKDLDGSSSNYTSKTDWGTGYTNIISETSSSWGPQYDERVWIDGTKYTSFYRDFEAEGWETPPAPWGAYLRYYKLGASDDAEVIVLMSVFRGGTYFDSIFQYNIYRSNADDDWLTDVTFPIFDPGEAPPNTYDPTRHVIPDIMYQGEHVYCRGTFRLVRLDTKQAVG